MWYAVMIHIISSDIYVFICGFVLLSFVVTMSYALSGFFLVHTLQSCCMWLTLCKWNNLEEHGKNRPVPVQNNIQPNRTKCVFCDMYCKEAPLWYHFRKQEKKIQRLETWFQNQRNLPELDIYRETESDFRVESYILYERNRKQQQTLARLLVSS